MSMLKDYWPFRSWERLLIDRFWPQACVLCGAECFASRRLCTGCSKDLPRIAHACLRCARQLTLDSSGTPGWKAVCGRCQSHPPPYAASFIPYRYAMPLAELVRRFKFDHHLELGPVLARLVLEGLPLDPAPDVIVPVPLHSKRLAERGFNQSLELARHLSRMSAVPYERRALCRIRNTPQQTTLDRRARRRNVAGAFTATGELQGVRAALVDDVVTTGATADAAATALLTAGATAVEIWAIARTP